MFAAAAVHVVSFESIGQMVSPRTRSQQLLNPVSLLEATNIYRHDAPSIHPSPSHTDEIQLPLREHMFIAPAPHTALPASTGGLKCTVAPRAVCPVYWFVARALAWAAKRSTELCPIRLGDACDRRQVCKAASSAPTWSAKCSTTASPCQLSQRRVTCSREGQL